MNVHQIMQQRFVDVPGLSQEMIDCLGNVEDTFTAIIYGESGHGKTNMTVRLLKELKSLGSMLYISYEEGHGRSIQDLISRHNLLHELPQLMFSDGETIDDLIDRLKKKKSPRVIVIDSWQYSEFTFEDYKRLKSHFVMGKSTGRRKIFIFISHVLGKKPDGKAALEVKRDCNIKIHVDHFVGFVTTRFSGSSKHFLIWEPGAKKHYGVKLNKLLIKVADKTKKLAKEPKAKVVKNKLQVLPPETPEEAEKRILENLKNTR